jgi:hypothetical protein
MEGSVNGHGWKAKVPSQVTKVATDFTDFREKVQQIPLGTIAIQKTNLIHKFRKLVFVIGEVGGLVWRGGVFRLESGEVAGDVPQVARSSSRQVEERRARPGRTVAGSRAKRGGKKGG